MPYSGDVRQEERLKKIEQAIYGAQLLHVRTTLEVYDRDPGTGLARHIESRPRHDLLIDPSDGFRKLRSKADDQDAWDELAQSAKLIHIPMTCSVKQAQILADNQAEVVAVISGSRAGKTHIGSFWALDQWVEFGGMHHDFWWVAPDWSQTEIGVNKLFTGDGESPPVFPPELVQYYPKDKNQSRQYGHLIDGSKIHFKQAGARGDNLKGYAPRAIVVDEGAAIRHRENWTVMLNRLTTHAGRMFVASTPVAGHWLRADVIVRAQHSDTVAHYEISIFDNPWQHPATVENLIEALGGHDDPVVRREFYGEWLPSAAALWPDWSPGRHLVQDHDITTVEQLRDAGFIPENYVDVTARAASQYWRESRNASVIIGQDFNIWPCSSVVARIFGDPRDRETWGVFIFDEVLTRGSIQNHCDVLSQKYPGAPVAVDATGARTGTHPSQGATGSSTNRLEMERAGFLAKSCNRYRGKPVAPRQIDSLNLCYRLQRRNRIIVHTRAQKLIEALDTQERAFDGRIAKEPNTASDRLSGPTDAMRYLVWPLFMAELKNKVGKYYDATG